MERISIHAPRTGSDNINYKAYGTPQISIHAPRTGSDPTSAGMFLVTSNFNPRSPHGERQVMRPYWDAVSAFQSTLPARGATRFAPAKRQNARISIHAPRTGSDSHRAEPSVFHDISIHAPRTGSDTRLTSAGRGTGRFQSTLPARGATNSRSRETAKSFHFNPRSPHGERRAP